MKKREIVNMEILGQLKSQLGYKLKAPLFHPLWNQSRAEFGPRLGYLVYDWVKREYEET
jgi:hypothetical protein